jgi:hypothetical protein
MKTTFLLLSSRALTAVALCALVCATAHAQAPAAPGATPAAASPTPRPKPLPYTDETYVRNATKSMSYLIQLANAAKTNITDPSLSRLRDSLASDLGTAMTELKRIADLHGTKLVTDVGGTEKYNLDRLAKVKLDKYPKEWIAEVFKEVKKLDHETDMAGKTAEDPDLKTYFTNYSPLIHNAFTGAEAADKAAKAPPKK